jgi:hypothetical protein
MKNITIETTEGTEKKKSSVISVCSLVKNPPGPDKD